jgi:hypothetical protein
VKRTGGWGGGLLSLCTAVLGVPTLIWHNWMETSFGAEPDAGRGAIVECVAGTLAFQRLEWIDRRKLAANRD